MTLQKENYESTETKSESTEPREEREFIKIGPGERIRNMLAVDTRLYTGQYGTSILLFLDDTTDDTGKYIYSITLANEEGKQGVFDRSMTETFVVFDEETEYWLIQDAFVDKPIWIAKVAVKGNNGRTYHKLEWGFEDGGKKPAKQKPALKKEDEGGPVDNKLLPEVNKCLVQAVTDGKNVFLAAQMLVEQFKEPADKAIDVAKAFYAKKGLL